jgi:hypothetical protein
VKKSPANNNRRFLLRNYWRILDVTLLFRGKIYLLVSLNRNDFLGAQVLPNNLENRIFNNSKRNSAKISRHFGKMGYKIVLSSLLDLDRAEKPAFSGERYFKNISIFS